MPSNLIRCSACGTRPSEKLAQVTWAWNRADGSRTAYRQRLCIQCFATNLLPLDRDYPSDAPLTCPACGIETEHDMDAVYATAFLPGQGKCRFEMPLCGPCAVELRNRAQVNAVHLEEMSPGASDQAPGNASTSSPWMELGLVSRVEP